MSTMRVAMLTYDTTLRGGLVHAINLAESLHDEGVVVELFALGNRQVEKETHVPITVYPKGGTLRSWIDTFVTSLPTDFDVYHAHDCIAGLALQELKTTGAITAPTVRTIHHINDFKTTSLSRLQDCAVSACDHAIVVSEYWREYVKRHYDVDATVIKNGVDERYFIEENKVKKDNSLLFVGVLHKRKGIAYLLEALEKIVDFDSISLDMVCNSINPNHTQDMPDQSFTPMDSLKASIHERGLDSRIRIHEHVSDSALADLYRRSGLFVFPTLNEGCGLVLLEAMASGTPVVTSDIAPIREFIDDGTNGLLVEPKNAGALADAVLRALTDGTLYTAMSKNGKETARTFSWREAGRKTRALYRDALKQKK